MDFWSRLIAGTSLSPQRRKATFSDPDKRLARFKREYGDLLQTWRSVSNLSRDQDACDAIRSLLQELTTMLSDEVRRPAPHVCIMFAATKKMFVPVSKIATTSYNELVIREAVAFFSTLIACEEEDFLESELFSRSLMTLLVRITGANSISLGSDTEVEVVELAFGIAAKIRLQPEILPTWFKARESAAGEIQEDDAHKRFTGKTHKEDFPLFYLLVDYIHHDGRIGDFARTGLLYIVESASTSAALEQWIVESDLATLMATGLGALYSQLSRKLVIDYPQEDLPSVLVMSDYERPTSTSEIVSSASEDFKGHMGTFLSHLIFWQDVLDHCKSVEVKQTLLEHFQVIFLQQLLYPSLLESSDMDGGSSVAVLTYLRRILESVEHPDMIHLILHYLLALPDTTPVNPSAPHAVSAARKLKSMGLASMVAAHAELQSDPDLFNLVDLILGSLKSQKQQTICVTLQLLSVIIRRNHRYAVTTLLNTKKILRDGPQRTIGAHKREMEYILSLAGEIGEIENFDESYENHIKDSMSLLESHPCSQKLIAPKVANVHNRIHGTQASIPGAPQDVSVHTLRSDDPVLKILMHILETFFINPVETNLCLTEALIDLASCGFMQLDGWLLPEPLTYIYDAENEDDTLIIIESSNPSFEESERAQLRAIRLARRTPNWPPSDLPALLQSLELLVAQIASYRSSIPRFDDLLLQRREVFQVLNISPTATPLPIRKGQTSRPDSERSTSRSASPTASKSVIDTLAQRIFPDLATSPRSTSPRGRSSEEQQRRSQDSQRNAAGGSHGQGTPILPPRQGSLHIAMLELDTTNRGGSRAFSPSPLRSQEAASSGGVASQAKALAELDKEILARRVGMQLKAAEIKAVQFPSLQVEDGVGEETGSEIAEELDQEEKEEEKLVSVSHVLTNVIILQEFLLELAALVQVRAGLFGELRFA